MVDTVSPTVEKSLNRKGREGREENLGDLCGFVLPKGNSMDRARRSLPLAVILFMIGASSLVRFSQDVRSVAVVGLSGAGFAFGVGFTLLVFGLRGKMKS